MSDCKSIGGVSFLNASLKYHATEMNKEEFVKWAKSAKQFEGHGEVLQGKYIDELYNYASSLVEADTTKKEAAPKKEADTTKK